jgi:hypothetical protein
MKSSTSRRLEQMDKKLEALLQELSKYDHDKLNATPPGGGWSPLQVMQHLIVSETLSLKYVKKKLSFQPTLKPIGMSVIWRTFLLKNYLKTPIKFKAPKMVSSEVLSEVLDFQELATQWRSDRKELKEYLAGLPSELDNKAIYKHPVAGRLGLDGMVTFFDIHFDRHRKQIERALK